MPTTIAQRLAAIRATIPSGVRLVCVSKFHPIADIREAYEAGERDFGESRVQELLPKYEALPKDIRWHFIGHLQTNKVRMILPFVHLIQSVDSLRLLETINREAEKIRRRVKVLLEVHVAKEESKSGFTPEEITSLNTKLSTLNYIDICGVMGMATNTHDREEILRCFRAIKSMGSYIQTTISDAHSSTELPADNKTIISMGMSNDYGMAIGEGSNMIRIGSDIFGERIVPRPT